jgi:serine/threonine protein kinase
MKIIANHEGFLKCFGANTSKDFLIFCDGDNQTYEYPDGHSLLLNEHCVGGNLLSLAKRRTGELIRTEKPKISKIFQQILIATNYLHTDLKMAHLNIRPSKILLDSDLNPKISGL